MADPAGNPQGGSGAAAEKKNRFSWDKLLHDGQERLSSLIDIEGPTPPRKSIDSVDSASTDTSTKRGGLDGLQIPSMSYFFGEGSGSQQGTPSRTHSRTSSGSSLAPLEDHSAGDKPPERSSMDRMRRTIMRHSEHTKDIEDDAKTKPDSPSSRKSKKPVEPVKPKRPVSENLTIMDKLIDRLVTSTLPTASIDTTATDSRSEWLKGQPPFNINTMGTNFRMMTARTSIIYETAYSVLELLEWRNPWSSVSALALYSYCVLNPRLLAIAPLLFICAKIMVPAYMYRHPSDPTAFKPQNPIPAPGPPLSEPVNPKPVPEFSREFFYNVVDTQNAMVLYVDAFDGAVEFLKRFAFFDADECTSSFVYLTLLASCGVLYFISPIVLKIVPWRAVFLVLGWVGLGLGHPKLRQHILQRLAYQYSPSLHIPDDLDYESEEEEEGAPGADTTEAEAAALKDGKDSSAKTESKEVKVLEEAVERVEEDFWKKVYNVAHKEFNFYEAHEQREVEVFEIQVMLRNKTVKPTTTAELESAEELKPEESAKDAEKLDSETGGHWEPSFYSNNPFLPLLRGNYLPPCDPHGASGMYFESEFGSTDKTSLKTLGSATGTLKEVMAPTAWQYVTGSHWKVDLQTHSWISTRGVPMVLDANKEPEQLLHIDDEVKWVYDTHPVSIITASGLAKKVNPAAGKAEQGVYVRRRRWTRSCTRKIVKREA